MKTPLDADGQPNPLFNRVRREQRDDSELIGFARGLLADGIVPEAEVVALENWFKARPSTWDRFPGNLLLTRVLKATGDGCVDKDECKDIAEMMLLLIGEQGGAPEGATMATALPLDEPAPALQFMGLTYVLTGKFAYGPRIRCEEEITTRGGECEANITRRTNVLVIGTLGSRDWRESAYGRKIEKAIEYKERGTSISIVCEDHWISHL